MAKNLLLIHCDALHADVFRHQKWPFLKTPHLDQLARESSVFTNAFVQYPTCIPSRASFITGLYPQQLGIFNHGYNLPEQVPTLADRLNMADWQSVAFGRTHRQHKGFQRFPEPTGPKAYGSRNQGFHGDSETIVGTFQGPIETQHDRAVADDFCQWLDARTDQRPLFAMVGFMAPHTPLYPPEEFDGTYQAEEMQLPDFDPAELENKPAKQRWIYDQRWAIHPEPVRRSMMAKYFDLCTYVDDCIGRALTALEKKGMADDTVVVFLSDHGEMLGDHGMIGKWFSLYDNVLRAPLAIRIPSGPGGGQTIPAQVEMIDLVPTLLDLFQQPGADQLPGQSLLPLIRDSGGEGREAIFSMMETARVIRTRDWKLAVHAGRSSFYTPDRSYPRELFHDDEGELYDLRVDPEEKVNLYHHPDHSAVRWQLARQLIEHEIKIQHELGNKMQ